jgi:hypothetical protein
MNLACSVSSRSTYARPIPPDRDPRDGSAFSSRVFSGVRPMIETMPLARASEAYARMMRGDARFRMALTMT